MARLSRLVIPGHPHLIVQRGLNRQPICITAEDRQMYLEALREVARVHGVSVHAYALLESEALIMATPATTDGVSKMMQALGRRYVAGFNRRHKRAGTLFDGRFRATVIESSVWFWKCLVFVESAPLRMSFGAGSLSGSSDALALSSAPHHLGRLVDPLIWEHGDYWSLGNTPFEREAAYKLLLERGLEQAELMALTAALDKGWPLGSATFIDQLALSTDRRLVPRKRGRRPKRP